MGYIKSEAIARHNNIGLDHSPVGKLHALTDDLRVLEYSTAYCVKVFVLIEL